MARMTKADEAEKNEALNDLRELLRPGDTIYTRLDHVSKSGMMRIITPLLLRVDAVKIFNESPRIPETNGTPRMVTLGDRELRPWYLGYTVHKALGYAINGGDHGLKVSGCGMDMGFSLVYNISATVFAGGFDCIGDRCPANDHNNVRNTACAICGRAMCPCGRLPTAEGECPECGKVAEKRYTLSNQPFDYGCACDNADPFYSRNSQGRSAMVCSQACASATWHHSDGGYALSHKWL